MRLIKFFGLILWVGSISLFSAVVLAKPHSIRVVLNMMEMRVVKTEEAKDELFFNITEYTNKAKKQTKAMRDYRVPEYPLHWLSNQVDQLKKVVLWQGEVFEGEEIRLVLSLMDEDNPPIDPNDGIGALEVTLTNEKGQLKTNLDSKKAYRFGGRHAHYTVRFIAQSMK